MKIYTNESGCPDITPGKKYEAKKGEKYPLSIIDDGGLEMEVKKSTAPDQKPIYKLYGVTFLVE